MYRHSESCPCGSGHSFANCCSPLLAGEQAAHSAEQLMRSRYTAYVRRDQAYLLRTWHPSTRPGELHLDQPASPNWISLGILGSSGATAGVVEATVEFAADYMLDGRRGRMHELSRFVHENGHWYYLDGETRDTPHSRPGRNDSCPCGSGRKFKRCCGK